MRVIKLTTVIFVRHGQSEGNLNRLFIGGTESPLTPLGIRQAKLTAMFLKDNYKIDKVYASDIGRAYNTGLEIATLQNIDIIKDPAFREVNAGEWSQKSYDYLQEKYKDSYSRWMNDIGHAVCDGGEGFTDVQKRVRKRAVELAEENDGKTICIATHATPIRSFICFIKSIKPENAKDINWVGNASVTVTEFDRNKWSIKLLNMTDHLGSCHTEFEKGV